MASQPTDSAATSATTASGDDWKSQLGPIKKDTRVKTADVTATKGNDFEGEKKKKKKR
jgi:hypothetical protein